MNTPFIFFGTPDLSVHTLNALEQKGLIPRVVISAPDAPQGRGLVVTPSPVSQWAQARNIPVYTPTTLKNNQEIHTICKEFSLGILAAYGKIIPQSLLDCFEKGILNVHPSLLPLYRGASPLESQILADEKRFGVTIIKLDAGCDTGDIIAQREIIFTHTPTKQILGEKTFSEGGTMIAQYLGPYLTGIIQPTTQDHASASLTRKFEKKDGELFETDSPRTKYLKFLAFQPWPGVFFFQNHKGLNLRIKVTDASFENETFVIKKVIPEGKKEMSYVDFLRGLHI